MEEPKCKICGDMGRAKPTLSEPDGEECECTKEPGIMADNPNVMRPCPFCGSENVRVGSFDKGSKGVECMDCWSYGGRAETYDNAIEKWNKRA